IPGLLQTGDHATTIFRVGVPPMPEHEIALRVAHRMERRQVLDSPNPAARWARSSPPASIR
ncbi:Scr1 family TA system antitoxin-like transcriptional regulator, partial [Streptomyces sp. WAC01526]|uniref:Scr1 family TA system antitoxin-like transcriptional regulator n=1 Tax=Streptomyces sp. WAC01526 TaxID=2588709 RepID=UPI00292A3CF9